MSYEATGSGTITLNVASATEQRNLQMALLTWYDNCCAAELNLCGDSMKFQIERAYQASKQKMLRYNDPEPFPEKRTRKYRKKQNESLIFCGMLVHAA